MDQAPLGVHVLFNEREAQIEWVLERLEESRIRIEYWDKAEAVPSSVGSENPWPILFFLGESQWGRTHRVLAANAMNSHGAKITVITAENPGGVGLEIYGLLQEHSAIEISLIEQDHRAFDRLVAEIRRAHFAVPYSIPSEHVPVRSEPFTGPTGPPDAVDTDKGDEELEHDDRSFFGDAGRSAVTEIVSSREDAPANGSASGESEIEPDKGPTKYVGLIRRVIYGDESDRADAINWIHRNKPTEGKDIAAEFRGALNLDNRLEMEGRLGKVRLPSQKSASARSWMLSCVIAADCEDIRSRKMIEEHLTPLTEPEPTIRFWVLAQLHLEGASYLDDAAAAVVSDPAPEISLLARAITNPSDSKLLGDCRNRLTSTDFNTAWPVLRALRIMPIPELAPYVCDFLSRSEPGSPEGYDAISSLCSPQMALAAAPILRESPGIDQFAGRVIAETGQSDPAAARRFAYLLKSLPDGLRSFQKVVETVGPSDASNSLQRAIWEITPRHNGGVAIATVTADTTQATRDYLDISEDVQTLAAVMLGKDIPLPLAIGLFGDWGAGKSFFMKSLRKATDELSASEHPRLCNRVASIEFNAWHYTDTNLWASLVNTIFGALANYVSPKVSFKDKQAELTSKLGSAKQTLGVANERVQRTLENIETSAKQLELAQKVREQRRVHLWELNANDLQELAKDNTDLQEAIEDVANQAGIDKVLVTGAKLEEVAEEASSDVNKTIELIHSVNQSKNWLIILALIVVVLFGFPFLAAWLQHLSKSPELARLGVQITEVTTFLTAFAGVASFTLRRFRKAVEVVSNAKRKADILLARKTAAPTREEVKLHERIDELRKEETRVLSDLARATADVANLEAELEATRQSRSLAKFLVERSRSGDYQKHLGLISTIRADFELLADRLANPIQEDAGLQAVDRIVLYIDDLDRCPEDRVLEVLQAVHLLLAYPIFVVVVGVDPRWLVHSLKRNFAALQAPGPGGDEPTDSSTATPQHYMEKIFQIPFSLRPMSKRGYTTLVDALMSPDESVGRASKRESAEATPNQVTLPPPNQVGGPKTLPLRPKDTPAAGIEPEPLESDESQVEETPRQQYLTFPVIHEDAMVIRHWETSFAERLYSLIPTPRAAKRFTNTYRILKAPLGPEQLLEFEGAEHAPGIFQVPMLLLALTIGFPNESRYLFGRAWEQVTTGGDPHQIFASPDTEDARQPTGHVLAKIRSITVADAFPRGRNAYEFWLPRVSRFSFDLTPIIEDGGYVTRD